jgi:hypothetical protein
MPKSFTVKSIELEIVMSDGDFGGGQNTKTIKGLACQADITKPGGKEKGSAQIKVWGLSYTDMENLTMLAFKPMESQKNLIKVSVGDEGEPLSQVFAGEITSAAADFNSSPDISMDFNAESGFYPAREVAEPLAVNGEARVSDLISAEVKKMGYSFKDEGVTDSVRNAVFNGSPLEKVRVMADQVGCELLVDDNQVIIIPPGGHREGSVPLLKDDSGMIGYPTFTQDGISVKCLYRPDLEIGALIKVESIVPKATGTWKITKLSHSLAAYQTKGGPWESAIEAQ